MPGSIVRYSVLAREFARSLSSFCHKKKTPRKIGARPQKYIPHQNMHVPVTHHKATNVHRLPFQGVLRYSGVFCDVVHLKGLADTKNILKVTECLKFFKVRACIYVVCMHVCIS